jgi:fucose permease
MTKIEQRTANIGLAIWRVQCFYETFVQGSTVVILLNFCAKNPPHRQAKNRYVPFEQNAAYK